jgi:hypothetical protein
MSVVEPVALDKPEIILRQNGRRKQIQCINLIDGEQIASMKTRQADNYFRGTQKSMIRLKSS